MKKSQTLSLQDQRLKTKCMRVAPPLSTLVMFRGSLLLEVLIGKFSTSQEHVPCRPRAARLGH